MIKVSAYSAAFSSLPHGLHPGPGIIATGLLKGGRTTSAAARYAQEAVAAMHMDPADLALVCICGPGGPMVQAFDNAWRQSPDGQLTGPDFARRSRRIHPFTLLRALQNQVAAHLSIHFGLHGPCLNALHHPTSLAWLMPRFARLLHTHRGILLVLAGAGEQEENQAVRRCLIGEGPALEGAVCLLLNQEPGLGILEPIPADATAEPNFLDRAAPIPMTGARLLRLITGSANEGILPLFDEGGQRAALRWRRT